MPIFTVDNMLYQMCVSSAWRDEFDVASATYTEYWPDGSVRLRSFETVDIPMDTELSLIDTYAALGIIQKYSDNDDLVVSAMHNHDTFATRKGETGDIVLGWNDRSK